MIFLGTTKNSQFSTHTILTYTKAMGHHHKTNNSRRSTGSFARLTGSGSGFVACCGMLAIIFIGLFGVSFAFTLPAQSSPSASGPISSPQTSSSSSSTSSQIVAGSATSLEDDNPLDFFHLTSSPWKQDKRFFGEGHYMPSYLMRRSGAPVMGTSSSPFVPSSILSRPFLYSDLTSFLPIRSGYLRGGVGGGEGSLRNYLIARKRNSDTTADDADDGDETGQDWSGSSSSSANEIRPMKSKKALSLFAHYKPSYYPDDDPGVPSDAGNIMVRARPMGGPLRWGK